MFAEPVWCLVPFLLLQGIHRTLVEPTLNLISVVLDTKQFDVNTVSRRAIYCVTQNMQSCTLSKNFAFVPLETRNYLEETRNRSAVLPL